MRPPDASDSRPDPAAALPPVSPWLARLLRPIHTAFIPAYFRLTVRDRERIPRTGPVLLCPTHRSRWDPVILPWLTGRLLRSMTSHDEIAGLAGWFMRRLGAFAVNTRRPTPGTFKACLAVLRAGQVLVIYPEGTIFYYPPDHVHPLRPGPAWIALKVQQELPPGESLQVVPIRFRYGHVFPRFRTPVEVLVHEPIAVADYLDRPERQAIADLTAAIQAGLGDVVNTSLAEMCVPRTPVEPAG